MVSIRYYTKYSVTFPGDDEPTWMANYYQAIKRANMEAGSIVRAHHYEEITTPVKVEQIPLETI